VLFSVDILRTHWVFQKKNYHLHYVLGHDKYTYIYKKEEDCVRGEILFFFGLTIPVNRFTQE